MSKKFKIYFLNFLVVFTTFSVMSQNQPITMSLEDRLELANQTFEAKNWVESRTQYEQLFDRGFFTERMLYRLAWIHEQEQNYPYAIFYLKKAEKEFGGPPLIEDKIKQLMLLQGTSRFYSKDPIAALRKSVGWLFLGLFVLGIGWYLFHLLYKPREAPVWRKNLNWLVHLFFAPLCLIIIWQVFFPAKEAVIVEPTSYYAGPGYGAHPVPDAFSPGETVKILNSEDIWYEVAAGSARYWVPKFTVRVL